jgi:hypothetical protein
VILASIYAATWAQDTYLREQVLLVNQVKSGMVLTEPGALALRVYEQTMVANRRIRSGHVIGGRIHALVRITPLILPVAFSVLWLYACHFAPRFHG